MPELNIYLIAIIFIFRFCIYAHDDDFGGESVSFEPLFKDIEEPEGAYFSETFSSQEKFYSKWILSKAKKEHTAEKINKYDGEWKLEEPIEIVLRGDKGLVLKSKARHHAISTKLNRPFVFDGKTFIVQFEVKLQRGLDCGGAYIKLLMESENLDLLDFYDRTPYVIMFGPDKCGNDMKIHFIFRHKNPLTGKFEEKHSMKKPYNLEKIFNDKMTHLYTLIIHPNNTFTVMIDMEVVAIGSLLHDMQPPVNPAKLIVDANDTKPLDWDDREKIPDVNAKKPDDWDETAPELVPDPYAKIPEGWLVDEEEWIADERALKPNDWDDDIDGHWEPPLMINPVCEKALGCGEWKPPLVKNLNFKGKWQPPVIKNPAYKGSWSPREIPNPNYFYDPHPYNMSAIGALGLELWSMAVDIMFDNFLITSSLEDARTWAEQTWRAKNEIEKTRDNYSKVSKIDAIILAANEKPWLWVVIILVIVVPTLIFIMFCCAPPPSKTDSGRLKKEDDLSRNGRGSSRDPRTQGQLRLRNQAFEHSDAAYKRRLL